MPFDRSASPPADMPSLFEAWMGTTEAEWEALGEAEDDSDNA